MIELAQAADWVMTGPVRPYSIESWQAAIDADSAGIGERADLPGALREQHRRRRR